MVSCSFAIIIPSGYLLAIKQKTSNPTEVFILSEDMVKQLTFKSGFLKT